LNQRTILRRFVSANASASTYTHPKLVRSEELMNEAVGLIDKGVCCIICLPRLALTTCRSSIACIPCWRQLWKCKKSLVVTRMGPLLRLDIIYWELRISDCKSIHSLKVCRCQSYEPSIQFLENFRSAVDILKNRADKESKSKLALVYFNFAQLLQALNKIDVCFLATPLSFSIYTIGSH
jgi:hypothetical protein